MSEYPLKNSFTFAFIAHQGQIEIESAILACSLIKYLDGKYVILALIPRIKNKILRPSRELLDLFNELKIQTKVINNNYIKFWQQKNLLNFISNKIFTFSTDINTDWLIFLDSDMICIKDINIEPFGESSIALKPVDLQAQILWRKLYKLCGVPYPKNTTVSTVDQVKNIPYFNSGFIACKQEKVKILYSTWLDIYQFLRKGNVIRKGLFTEFYADQVSLSIALEKTGLSYHVLDEAYNFPLHLKNDAVASNISFVHYHKPEFLIRSEKMRLIIKNLVADFPELNKILSTHRAWHDLI